MFKLLQTAIFFTTMLLSISLAAQINDNNIPHASPQQTIRVKEKKLVDKAYKLYNNNEDKKAYKIAHFPLTILSLLSTSAEKTLSGMS